VWTSENPLKPKFARLRSRRPRTTEGRLSLVGYYLVLMYVHHEASVLYIRMSLSIGPGLCWMLDLNFREFLFHAIG
jgi:hypothetical protein